MSLMAFTEKPKLITKEKAMNPQKTSRGEVAEVTPSPKPTENGKRKIVQAIGRINLTYFEFIFIFY
jgi:hypothetical protein